MKNYIIIMFLSLLIIIPTIFFFLSLNEDYNINYNIDNEIYSIYITGEVTYEGEIEIKAGSKLKDFIYEYTTNNSDFSSFDENEEVENHKLYHIAYKDKISINTASLELLKTLDDIGDVRAKKIIEGRPYNKTIDLVNNNIISSGIYEKIKNDISV